MKENLDEMMWWCDKCDSPVYDWACKCPRCEIGNIDEAIKKVHMDNDTRNTDSGSRVVLDSRSD